jgi:hypothetical protein
VNNDLQNVIEQADLLIKERKFKSAWQVLLPYQDDPMARERLLWLKQKRQQTQQAGKAQNKQSNYRPRYFRYVLIILPILIGLSILVFYGLPRRETVLPIVVPEVTQVISVPTASVPPSSSPTEVRPTENTQEASLQEQLRDWFVTVEGVKNVLSLDVDVADGEPPLVYAEILVNAGGNDTRIPDRFVQKMNETLNTTQYSDFVIIINDETRIVEYAFDSEKIMWHQTELASTTPTATEAS